MRHFNMKNFRTVLGLEFEEVQVLCGVSESYLQKIERGTKETPSYVRLILRLLEKRPKLLKQLKLECEEIRLKSEATGLPAHVVTLLRMSLLDPTTADSAQRMIVAVARTVPSKEEAAAA